MQILQINHIKQKQQQCYTGCNSFSLHIKSKKSTAPFGN